MKSLGAFLKYIRKQRNLTQEQVADRLNIVTPVLSKWENDKAVPSLDMLCKLCNVLTVSIEECISAEPTDGERLLPPENYDPIKLGETIKDLRIKNGWSQTEVGKKLFITSQTVSKWESGGISSLEILGKLAELFGLTPTELLNGLEHIRSIPEKQTAAEQLKKPKRFVLKITAVILAVIIFLSAIAGLVVGLVLRDSGGPDSDITRPEYPIPPVDVDNGQQTPPEADIPEGASFVTPIKEFYSADKAGQDISGNFKFGGMYFEVAESTPVYAIADGIVVTLDNLLFGDNNYYIEIEHTDGFVSKYSYCVTADLTVGQEVKKGQQIGTNYNFKKSDEGSYNFVLNLFLNGNRVDPFEYITELPEPVERHVHEWGEWKSDNAQHWQECECGIENERQSHTFEKNICTVCGYEKYVPPKQDDELKVAFCLPMQSEVYRKHYEEIIYDDGGSYEHLGVDFSANKGDKVCAVADGEIESILDRTDYFIIRVNHGDGIVSVYSGVVPVDGLTVGQQVEKGSIIACVAETPINSESDDGPHLHFVIWVNNVIENPLDYIPYEKKQT